MGQSKAFKLGRDSRTGEFIRVKEAQRRPNTTTIGRVVNYVCSVGKSNSLNTERLKYDRKKTY
jgi:hypothetical protein